jgi:predicted nucleic acid-binding protein
MIVVADASPLHYLILIEQIVLLERLYGSVFVPEAVARELRAARAPDSVRAWIAEPPPWVQVVSVAPNEAALVAEWLDAGERAAIALAERIRADLILIDDADGKAEAARRKFRVTGTLGVLRAGADEGLIDVPEVLARLDATTFYSDRALIEMLFGKWLKRGQITHGVAGADSTLPLCRAANDRRRVPHGAALAALWTDRPRRSDRSLPNQSCRGRLFSRPGARRGIWSGACDAGEAEDAVREHGGFCQPLGDRFWGQAKPSSALCGRARTRNSLAELHLERGEVAEWLKAAVC